MISLVAIALGLPLTVGLSKLFGGLGDTSLFGFVLPILTLPWLTLLGSGLFGASKRRAETLLVTDDEIVAGSRRVRIADVRSTIAVPLPDHRVRADLVLSNGNVLEANLATQLEANALFDAARVDRTRRTAVLRLGRMFRRFMSGIGTFVLGCVSMTLLVRVDSTAAFGVFFLYAIPLLIYLAVRHFGSAEITVGVDGVKVVHGLRTRLHPFEGLEVVRVAKRDGAIELVYRGQPRAEQPRDGRVERFFGSDDDPLKREAAVTRIEEALAHYRTSRTERGVAELLERRGRPLDAWREELARLVAPDGEYRAAHVGESNARRVLLDASASLEQRVGAAVALVAVKGDEARRDVRIAAEACVEPRLRVALERAADGDIDEDALQMERRA